MATSPNYAWAEPDNSSLVKNGAQDIRTLGDAIDTSVWNIGYGQAGKNKIINGDFGIWQRGTTINFSAAGGYVADRWKSDSGTGGVLAVTRQTFTAGQTDVPNAIYFMQANYTTSGTGTVALEQRIENVNTFAGQGVTLSFYAKVSSGTKSVTPRLIQDFGSGGSSSVLTNLTAQTLTTTWQRFSISTTVASITGKTVGTSSYLRVDLDTGTSGILTFSFANVQLEYGSKATPFQTASGGSPQAELAMCQRYFNRIADFSSGGSNSQQMIVTAQNFATTGGFGVLQYPVMRTTPSVTFSGNADFTVTGVAGNNIATTAMAANSIKPNSCEIRYTVTTGVIAGNASLCYTTASTGKLDLSSEL